jgi:branched-chain amino acid transport system substrate-binding protein
MSTQLKLRRFVLACGLAAFAAASLSIPPAHAQDRLVIGSVMDLTGPVATLAQYAKRGVDIALAEVNAAGGVNGKPVELVSLNSESKPDLASSLGLRLAAREDVNVMIGGNFGSTALALSAVAARQKVPLISPTGLVNDEQRNNRYAFFGLVDFSDFSDAMLAYAKKKGYKRIAMLRLEREYGELGSKFIRHFAPKHGVEIVAEERGADGDRDFTAQLTKIREANPDFLVVWFANPGGSLVLKNARQLGIRTPMVAPISMDSVATVKVAGSAAEGLVLAAQIAGDDVQERQKTFAAAYAKAYPDTPQPNSLEGVGYDLVKIAVAAAKSIQPPYTREKMRDALASLKYDGAGTVVRYSDKKNDPSPETIVLTQIKDGKFVIAK